MNARHVHTSGKYANGTCEIMHAVTEQKEIGENALELIRLKSDMKKRELPHLVI